MSMGELREIISIECGCYHESKDIECGIEMCGDRSWLPPSLVLPMLSAIIIKRASSDMGSSR